MKKLNYLNTISGTGWVPEDLELECPNCNEIINVTKRQRVAICPDEDCKTKFKIIKGYEVYHKLEE